MSLVFGLAWRKLFVFALIMAVSQGIAQQAMAQGIDGGAFDGAVWGYKLTPKNERLGVQSGAFRVNNNVLYQKDKPEDKAFSKVVGKNIPSGRRTQMVFEDLRGHGPNGGIRRISGTARLGMEKGGEWGGQFVDSNGNNWQFHVSRQRE
jgi:hypothetical protein